MRNKNREALLKLVVAAVVGLFLLDRVILTPALAGWKEQGERIGALREKVGRGRQLVERERSIRGRWQEMLRTDLPEEMSAAEGEVYKAIGRWGIASHVSFTSLTPNWRTQEEGRAMFECRAAATGDQASLGRLLYEIETDPLPAHLDECEITARDAKGRGLAMTLRFSFVRLIEPVKGAR